VNSYSTSVEAGEQIDRRSPIWQVESSEPAWRQPLRITQELGKTTKTDQDRVTVEKASKRYAKKHSSTPQARSSDNAMKSTVI